VEWECTLHNSKSENSKNNPSLEVELGAWLMDMGRNPCAPQRSLDPSVSQRLGPLKTICHETDVFLDIYTRIRQAREKGSGLRVQ